MSTEREALTDLLRSNEMRPSCQAGMVTRCLCQGCATSRARAALAQPVAASVEQPRMTRAPTDQDLIDFAVAEEFLLFCDEEEFVQIARGVLREFTEPPPTPA